MVESVATILERAAASRIEDWFRVVKLDSRLTDVPLTPEQRHGHLPQLFRDVVVRLRADLPIGSKSPMVSSRSKARVVTPPPGLLCGDDGRRISHPPGLHLAWFSRVPPSVVLTRTGPHEKGSYNCRVGSLVARPQYNALAAIVAWTGQVWASVQMEVTMKLHVSITCVVMFAAAGAWTGTN
jgi:hypothetical protein